MRTVSETRTNDYRSLLRYLANIFVCLHHSFDPVGQHAVLLAHVDYTPRSGKQNQNKSLQKLIVHLAKVTV